MLKDNDAKLIYKKIPKRENHSHKYDYGHILVVGGNEGMAGAARLCAEACLRSGAGLVSVATKDTNSEVILAGRYELMVHGVRKEQQLQELIDRCNVIIIGPGLGRDDWAKTMLSTVLSSELPKVVDADALSLLREIGHKCKNSIITPHSGEAARLLQTESQKVEAHRVNAITSLRQISDVIVLKGSQTLISDDKEIYVNKTGNPALATAGTGDVLAGVIGALLGQKLSLIEAARLGVWLHGLAADAYVNDGNHEGSMIASDLIEYFKKMI
jgi:NAD(P)H-hydrate epimerase